MENFSKFSVANNHKKSFDSEIREARAYLDRLDNDYSIKYQRVNKLSNDKKRYVDSLEEKFKKYNLKYKQPLVANDNEDIRRYADDLQGELAISLASLDESKKDQVLEDSLEISSEAAKIINLTNYINMEAKALLELEHELSTIRVPEKDSKEEVVIDFNSFKKNRKQEETKEESMEEKGEIIPFELPEAQMEEEIPADIFKTETTNPDDIDEQSIQQYFSNKFEETPNVKVASGDEDEVESNDNEDEVTVELKGDSSFVDLVEKVYGDASYWKYVYNYNDNNKGVVDRVAAFEAISVEDAVYKRGIWNDVMITFPTELVTFVETNSEENGRKLAA
jgi:hypothetical protein